jgi:hypothetical protein
MIVRNQFSARAGLCDKKSDPEVTSKEPVIAQLTAELR